MSKIVYPEEILRERIAKLEAENERLRDTMDRVANQLEHAAITAMLFAGKAEQ